MTVQTAIYLASIANGVKAVTIVLAICAAITVVVMLVMNTENRQYGRKVISNYLIATFVALTVILSFAGALIPDRDAVLAMNGVNGTIMQSIDAKGEIK